MAMSRHGQQMVDLLEIYHARSLRNHVMRELARLDCDESLAAGTRPGAARRNPRVLRSDADHERRLLFTLGDLPH